MIIYLATWAEDNQGDTLSKGRCKNRLLSYFFLKDLGPEWLKEYIEKSNRIMNEGV